ncbi:MAG: Dip2/Utp12 protein, partial [Paramarteilia canceri]
MSGLYRYQPDGRIGQVTSADCLHINSESDKKNVGDLSIFSCTGEDVTQWSMKQSKKIMDFWGSNRDAQSVKIATHGSKIIVGYYDGYISFFTTQSNESIQRIKAHKKLITCLAIDSKGEYAASGSLDCSINLLNCNDHEGIAKLNGHNGPITQIKFDSIAEKMISGSQDNSLMVWDIKSKACIHRYLMNSEIPWDFTFLDGNKYLAVGTSSNQIYILKRIESSKMFDFCFEEFTKILRSSKSKVKKLKSIRNGQYLLSMGKERFVEVFWITDDKYRKKLLKKKQKAIGSNGSELALEPFEIFKQLDPLYFKSDPLDFDIIELNNKSSNIIMSVQIKPNNIISSCCHIDEKRNLKMDENFFDLCQFSSGGEIKEISFSPNGEKICSLTRRFSKLWGWDDLLSFRTIGQSNKVLVTCCSFIDESKLALGLSNGTIEIYNTLTNEKLLEIDTEIESEVVKLITINKNDTQYLIAAIDKTIVIYVCKNDNYTKKCSVELADKCTTFTITKDNRNIVSALLNNNIQ